MKFLFRFRKIASTLIFTLTLLAGSGTVYAQETPLTLLQMMTALRSTSSGMNLAQKNNFVRQRVLQRGVTFTLSEDLVKEFQNAGASDPLIDAIGISGPEANQTATSKSAKLEPDIEFARLWVEQNVEQDGRLGISVHTKYTALNLTGTPLQLTIRFRDPANATLRSSNGNYANKNGELALFKNFIPGSDAAIFDDWAVFLPYTELPVSNGPNALKIDANIIYPEGKLLKHLTLHEVTINKPKPSLTAPKAVFEKMWVDYGVTEGDRLGMRIHVRLKTSNLKATTCYLRISFEKETGERLTAKNPFYADRSGGVTLFSELTPASVTAFYDDVIVFMPYEELNLDPGTYVLKMRADLTFPDESLIARLNYYPFRYNQRPS